MHKWKKSLSFLMALTLLASSSPAVTEMTAEKLSAFAVQASAASYEVSDDGFQYVVYNKGTANAYAEIVGFEAEELDLKIPSEIDGITVTRIAKNAFAGSECETLETIYVPNTIVSVGANAFIGCKNIKSGTIPTKFIAICAAASDIDVPENISQLVTFKIKNSQETEVSIPDGLATIYDYTIDNQTLKDRNVSVPSELLGMAESEYSNLTASQLSNFLKNHNTIQRITFRNRECVIGGNLPTTYVSGNTSKPVVIRGYISSTAKTFADSNNYDWEPLDKDLDALKEEISITATGEQLENGQLNISVTADAGDYTIVKTGAVMDRNGKITSAEEAAESMTIDSSFSKLSAKNKNTYTKAFEDTGNGIWYVGFVTINIDGTEYTFYSEPGYVKKATKVEEELSVELEIDQSQALNGKFKFLTTASAGNITDYTIKNCGIVIDRTGTVTSEASAKELLIVDSSNTDIKTYGTAKESVSINANDKGKGIWAVGFAVIEVDGETYTVYSEPQYVEKEAPVEDSLSVSSSVLSVNENEPTQFKLSVAAETGKYTVENIGIIYNRTGTVTEENAEEALVIDSTVDKVKSMFTTGKNDISINIKDTGKGIWFVGVVEVVVDGVSHYAYSEPRYVEANMPINELINTKIEFESMDSGAYLHLKTNTDAAGYTVKEIGFVFNRNGKVTNAEQAREQLKAPSETNGKQSGYAYGALYNPDYYPDAAANEQLTADKKEVTVSLRDSKDMGIWGVSYLTVVDKNGESYTGYSDPIYFTNEDGVLSNIALSLDVNQADEGNIRFTTTASTDYTVTKCGAILNRNGLVTDEASAREQLVHGTTTKNIYDQYKANQTSTVISIKDTKGLGVWGVGFCEVEANLVIDGKNVKKTYVKHTAPSYLKAE